MVGLEDPNGRGVAREFPIRKRNAKREKSTPTSKGKKPIREILYQIAGRRKIRVETGQLGRRKKTSLPRCTQKKAWMIGECQKTFTGGKARSLCLMRKQSKLFKGRWAKGERTGEIRVKTRLGIVNKSLETLHEEGPQIGKLKDEDGR